MIIDQSWFPVGPRAGRGQHGKTPKAWKLRRVLGFGREVAMRKHLRVSYRKRCKMAKDKKKRKASWTNWAMKTGASFWKKCTSFVVGDGKPEPDHVPSVSHSDQDMMGHTVTTLRFYPDGYFDDTKNWNWEEDGVPFSSNKHWPFAYNPKHWSTS